MIQAAEFPIRSAVLLLAAAGVLLLQIFLSRRTSPWPGRMLPILSFCASLFIPLTMVYTEGMWLQMLLTLLVANIPTYLLLGIYFACRWKFRRKPQMDKLNIQDLG